MSDYRYRVSLRISHPFMDPAELTRLLGREPDHAVRAGEPRRTPRGRQLGGAQAHTHWSIGLVENRDSDHALETALAEIAVELTPHASLLKRIRSEGGRAELFVGWFLDANGGVEFDAGLLSRLGELGLDLSFDVYPPGASGRAVVPSS